MSGVRLHHPYLANCTLVAELEMQYHNRQARACSLCGKEHLRKAIHLRLDDTGHVIVSKEVFEKLQNVFLAGMEVANEVESPPPLAVGAVAQPKIEVYEAPLNGQNAQRFYVPGRTKYESADIIQRPFNPIAEIIQEATDRQLTADRARKRSMFILGRRRNG